MVEQTVGIPGVERASITGLLGQQARDEVAGIVGQVGGNLVVHRADQQVGGLHGF